MGRDELFEQVFQRTGADRPRFESLLEQRHVLQGELLEQRALVGEVSVDRRLADSGVVGGLGAATVTINVNEAH